MFKFPTGYLSPKLEGRELSLGYRSVFARQPIASGELLAVWGGEIISSEELITLPAIYQRLCVQVEEDFYLVSSREGAADWVNHSCDPNAGMRGQIAVVSMREIAAGEEVCIDYAMVDGTPYDEFECQCGGARCRRFITGNDWANPELQIQYAGYFSPYLQERIAKRLYN